MVSHFTDKICSAVTFTTGRPVDHPRHTRAHTFYFWFLANWIIFDFMTTAKVHVHQATLIRITSNQKSIHPHLEHIKRATTTNRQNRQNRMSHNNMWSSRAIKKKFVRIIETRHFSVQCPLSKYKQNHNYFAIIYERNSCVYGDWFLRRLIH